MILVTRTSMPPFEEYVNEIRDLWDTHWLTNMGPKHQEFEKQLRTFLNVKNIALYTNGHNALECALEAFNLSGEVITTPFTFASTTHAIVRKGLTPVFADIMPADCTIDPESIEQLITPQTSAIVPVHVYGHLCDVEAIQEIANKYNLKVIYDAAHAFGVKRDGISAAVFGDASIFSFHATKVFNSIEGGAICFGDSNMRTVLDQLKNFGIMGPDKVERVGGNAKMNEFCAAMGICNLRHVEDEIKKREKVEYRYRSHLSDVSGITLLEPQPGVEGNHAYFPVFIEEDFGKTRDDVLSALASRGIYGRKYFFPLVTDFECYHSVFDSSLTPVAQDRAKRVLTLPMYGDLPLDVVDEICQTILLLGGKTRSSR